MSRTQLSVTDTDALDRLAVFTGLGWTTSMLGYLTTAVGHATLPGPVADPRLLLSVGVVLLMATLGLDRLQNRLSGGETDRRTRRSGRSTPRDPPAPEDP